MLIHLILATVAWYAGAQNTDNCTATWTASKDVITSPGYPGNFTDNFTCTYIIVGDGHRQFITIHMLELDTSYCYYYDDPCCHWLIIDDGPKLCQPTTFHKTYVFQDRFIIKFGISPYKRYYSKWMRFKMHYSTAIDINDNCTSFHTNTSGQISTSCSSCNCTYNNCTNTIIGSGNVQILTLDFVSLGFMTSPNCDIGWFTINGGPKICASTRFELTYVLFGSVDIVTHGADRSGGSCPGFVVIYAVQDNHTTTLNASEGEITTPAYSHIPYSYFNYTYVIVGDANTQIITIDFLEMDQTTCSAFNIGCYCGWLTINDGPKVCSYTTFHQTYVFRDRFTIMFGTDHRSIVRASSKGFFKMYYSVSDLDAKDACTSAHIDASGQISMPCSSCNCAYNNCTNTIIGTESFHTVILDFIALNFKSSPNCDDGWFTIDGGPKICTSTPFKATYTFWSSLDIVTRAGDVDTCGDFVVNYTVQAVDNRTLTYSTGSGQLIGPTFPGQWTYFSVGSIYYIIVGQFIPQYLTLDITFTLLYFGLCYHDRLSLNGREDLCYDGKYNRTYLSQQQDFIIEFHGVFGSSFLINYEKRDTMKGSSWFSYTMIGKTDNWNLDSLLVFI